MDEAALSDLGLIALQAAALFTYDDQGQLLTTNEPDPVRAPRLFLGLTGEGVTWRYRDDVPKEIVRIVSRRLDAATHLTDPRHLPAIVDGLREALAAQAPVTEVWEGPAFHFPAAIPAPAGVTAITPNEAALLRKHFPYTAEHLTDESPCFAVVADGAAVAVCRGVRRTRWVTEAGVNTAESYRRRGYAVRVVAAWARAVREAGLIPLYSTSGDNAASRAVARKLGLIQYGVDLSLT